MKNLLAGLTLVAVSAELPAQCNPSIPSNAMVMNTTQTIGFGGAQLWICPGDTITSNGGSHTVYLESTAVFQAGGGSNTIYCPPGAKVNVTSGSNIIYYVNAADLISTGGGPTLTQCPSISYNYSNAPTPGCQMTTGILDDHDKVFSVYPNPSSGSIRIRSSAQKTGVVVEVRDIAGKIMQSFSFVSFMDENMDISALPGGIYFVRVADNSGMIFTERILIH